MSFIKKVLYSLYNNIFVFSAIFFVGLGVAVYVLMGKEAVSMLSEQMLHREQAITRAASNSIHGFVDLLGKSMIVYLRTYGGDREELASSFTSEWKGTPVFSAVIVSKDGIVDTVYERAAKFIPHEVSPKVDDRDYYIWAKSAKAGEIFVGNPIKPRSGTVQDQFLLPLSTPIMKNGVFDGVFGVTLLLDDLTKSYLDSLRISDKTEVYLVSQEGLIIYSDRFQEPIGRNIFDHLEENSFLGSSLVSGVVRDTLNAGGEGKLKIVYPSFDSGILSEKLIAYAPVNLGNGQHWFLAVATPIQDALIFMTPFYLRQVILIILIFISILIYSVRFSKIRGFKEGHELYHKERDQEPPLTP